MILILMPYRQGSSDFNTLTMLQCVIVGQVVATDLVQFSSPTLVRTEPPNIGIDILSYNGRDFSIKNAFDIDRHSRTQVGIHSTLRDMYIY